ncbi:hypothetical protein [Thiolapillus sp.]
MPISTLSAVLFLSLTSGSGLAEGNICKGMEQKACSQSSACRWVKPYKRTDGIKVAGYCRKLPGKSQAAQGKPPASRKG